MRSQRGVVIAVRSSASCPEGEHVYGGENAWVETQCPNDWDYDDDGAGPSDGYEVTSELDWMRMFWQLTSDDADAVRESPIPGDPASLARLLDLYAAAMVEAGPANAPYWEHFAAAAEGTSVEARLEDLSTANGVDNGHGVP